MNSVNNAPFGDKLEPRYTGTPGDHLCLRAMADLTGPSRLPKTRKSKDTPTPIGEHLSDTHLSHKHSTFPGMPSLSAMLCALVAAKAMACMCTGFRHQLPVLVPTIEVRSSCPCITCHIPHSHLLPAMKCPWHSTPPPMHSLSHSLCADSALRGCHGDHPPPGRHTPTSGVSGGDAKRINI